MLRLFMLALCAVVFVSCSKNDDQPSVTPIPDIIIGTVEDITVTPVDLNTPGQGSMLILMNGALYKVQFNATSEAQSNATMFLAQDTVLTSSSREYGNFGQDFVSYNPVQDNELEITFKDGIRKIQGSYTLQTSFGGNFGRDIISQWRVANDPTKPTQKAMDDLRNFMMRYVDSNGPEPGITPVYLAVTVSRQ